MLGTAWCFKVKLETFLQINSTDKRETGREFWMGLYCSSRIRYADWGSSDLNRQKPNVVRLFVDNIFFCPPNFFPIIWETNGQAS